MEEYFRKRITKNDDYEGFAPTFNLHCQLKSNVQVKVYDGAADYYAHVKQVEHDPPPHIENFCQELRQQLGHKKTSHVSTRCLKTIRKLTADLNASLTCEPAEHLEPKIPELKSPSPLKFYPRMMH